MNSQNLNLLKTATIELQKFSSNLDQYSKYTSKLTSENLHTLSDQIIHSILYSVYIELNLRTSKIQSNLMNKIAAVRQTAVKIMINDALYLQKMNRLLFTGVTETCQLFPQLNDYLCMRNSRIVAMENFSITIHTLAAKVQEKNALYIACLPMSDGKIFRYSNEFHLKIDKTYLLNQGGEKMLISCLTNPTHAPCVELFVDPNFDLVSIHQPSGTYFIVHNDQVILYHKDGIIAKTSDSTNVKLDQPKAFILSDFPIGLYNGVDTVIINWDEFAG